jgi:hypothetical protein
LLIKPENIYDRLKSFFAFLVVIVDIFSISEPKISASFSATYLVLPGSLVLPRNGTGLRKGESVSTNNLSNGNFLATFGK